MLPLKTLLSMRMFDVVTVINAMVMPGDTVGGILKCDVLSSV
jgi:hypothetical protein